MTRVAVPLPFRERVEALGDLTYGQIHKAITESTIHEVPLSIITSTQKTVGGPRLAMYESGQVKHRGDPKLVLNGDGLYLWDGHHRGTMAMRKGQRTIRAHVAKPTARPPIPFGKPGALLMMGGPEWRPGAMQAEYREHDVQEVAQVIGRIAVIEIEGPLESKPSAGWWGYFDDHESIFCRYANAIQSEDIDAVLLKIDSPGGAAAGLNEAVNAMRRLKKKTGKRVVAYADEGAYSAAYAYACVADQIYMPKPGGVGSIGVVSQLVSFADANKKAGVRVEIITSGARKSDGNPDVPITDEAIAHVQRRVDQLAKIYFKLVAKARGIDAKPLQADTFYGKDALKRGLVDELLTLEETIDRMALDNPSRSKSSSRHKSAQAGTPKEQGRMNLKEAKAQYKAAIASGDQARIAKAEADLDTAYAGKKVVTTETKSTESSSESSSSSSESSSESEEEEEESMPSNEESKHVDTSDIESSSSSSESSEEEEEEEEKKEKTAEEDEHRQVAKETARSLVASHATLGPFRKPIERAIRKSLASSTKRGAKLESVAKSAAKLTGRKSLSAILGALDAMPSRKDADKSLRKEVASLKADRLRAKVTTMVKKGIKAGKVTPAEKDSLIAAGMNDPSWLKGNIKARPVLVRSGAEGFRPREGTDGGPTAGLGAPQNADQQKMRDTMLAAMSEEERKTFLAARAEIEKRNGATHTAPKI